MDFGIILVAGEGAVAVILVVPRVVPELDVAVDGRAGVRASPVRSEFAAGRGRAERRGSCGGRAGERRDDGASGETAHTHAYTHRCAAQLWLSVRRSVRPTIAEGKERRASDDCCFSFRPSFRVYRARRDGEREKETEN